MSDLKFFPVLVNHVAPSVQPHHLRHLFSQRGGRVVDVLIVSSHGFVNMARERDAHDVIHALNGRRLHSDLLHVDYSEELKSYLVSRGVGYTCTIDPRTHRRVFGHPLYPSGSQIESPFYCDDSDARDQISSLADDPHLVEERLRKVNQELSALDRSEIFSRDSRSYRSRERRWRQTSDRERGHIHQHRDRSPHRMEGRYERGAEEERYQARSRSPVENHSDLSSLKTRDGKDYQQLVGGPHHSVSSHQLTGATCGQNKVQESVRRGARFEHLKLQREAERPTTTTEGPGGSTAGDDDVVILKSRAEQKSTELPLPVPVATARSDGDSQAGSLIENFDQKSRQRSDIFQSWQAGPVRADTSQQQYFDGYNFSGACQPCQESVREIEGAQTDEALVSVSVPGPSFKQPSSQDLRLIIQTVERAAKSSLSPDTSHAPPSVTEGPEEGPKTHRKLHVSGLNSRINDFDLKDVFSSYGQVVRVDSKMTYAFILIFSSELSIVKCVCELDGRKLKGSKLRVNFIKGSYEDSQKFKDKWSAEISKFMSAEHKKSNSAHLYQPPSKVCLSQIGEGLKNIDMSLSLGPLPCEDVEGSVLNLPPPIDSRLGTRQQSPSAGINHLEEVEGSIHSIQSNLILIEFFHPLTECRCLAKLIPSQMYVNGRQSLGHLIKSDSSLSWPGALQDFLQTGRRVVMDVRRREEWVALRVWLPGERPQQGSETVSLAGREQQISSAVIVQLLPAWGILSSSQGKILFQANHLHWGTGTLQEEDSILEKTDLEVGDVVAVHYSRASLSNISEIINDNPDGFNRSATEHTALLVWRISAEVDPWVFYSQPAISSVQFLSSSSTLHRELPGESEARHFKVKGEVVQLQLPAGGLVHISKEARQQLGLSLLDSSAGIVYFHRSRLYLNGSKIRPEESLDDELMPGDTVCMDITTNIYVSPGDPHVSCSTAASAAWVALAVRANSAMRGVTIAERLRRQEGSEDNMVSARLVYLHTPATSNGPVTSGVAVLHSGEFMGQRVEFDREVCSAFGFSLHKANLSHLFKFGKT